MMIDVYLIEKYDKHLTMVVSPSALILTILVLIFIKQVTHTYKHLSSLFLRCQNNVEELILYVESHK